MLVIKTLRQLFGTGIKCSAQVIKGEIRLHEAWLHVAHVQEFSNHFTI
jgi:hypothetical protein